MVIGVFLDSDFLETILEKYDILKKHCNGFKT